MNKIKKILMLLLSFLFVVALLYEFDYLAFYNGYSSINVILLILSLLLIIISYFIITYSDKTYNKNVYVIDLSFNKGIKINKKEMNGKFYSIYFLCSFSFLIYSIGFFVCSVAFSFDYIFFFIMLCSLIIFSIIYMIYYNEKTTFKDLFLTIFLIIYTIVIIIFLAKTINTANMNFEYEILHNNSAIYYILDYIIVWAIPIIMYYLRSIIVLIEILIKKNKAKKNKVKN